MYDTSDYLARWPQYLPFPYDITRDECDPVPNRNAVDWPQSQWAPLYLQPGSPSFQPYRYPKDGPLTRAQPLVSTEDPALSSKRFYFVPSANGGDTNAVYESYMPLGDCGCGGGAYGAPCGCTARTNEGEAGMPTWQKVALVGVAAAALYHFVLKKK